MTGYLVILAAVCLAASGAPPAPPRLYQQHAPAHLQGISQLDYFMENPEVIHYYNQAQQKQGNINSQNGAPSRLESLEPDSEVELIPGAQQPQQPPQQPPVSPNLPGLAPGQRVFIVHMPVPGYRPGTIGGYQPVYIVAASPQGNPGYTTNGYQNAILVNPSGQTYLSPFFGYPQAAGVAGQGHPAGLVVGAAPLPFNRPFEQVYQDQAYAYQPAPGQHAAGGRGPLHLMQLVNLQGQPAHSANNPIANGQEASQPKSNSDQKRVGEASESDEETTEAEPRRNARPTPPHATIRNKV